MSSEQFPEVVTQLKNLLKTFEDKLIVKVNNDERYYLDAKTHPLKKDENVFFAGVEIKKNYVSFHLFPVYMYPELLNEVSPELRKKMQGKSCFNFKKSDAELFVQLKRLTERGFKKYEENNLL
ncbi:MAG TPA: hypothetical protein VEC36_02920 [Patescibacteria group bacterium]|nr:hypothetical protein [Patescibacteria group bacterium]